MKWRLWNSCCLNWVSKLKPSQFTKTTKVQSTWLAILFISSESSTFTYGITLSARRLLMERLLYWWFLLEPTLSTCIPRLFQRWCLIHCRLLLSVELNIYDVTIVTFIQMILLWIIPSHWYWMLYIVKLVNDTVPTWTIWAKSVSVCSLNTGGVLTLNLGSSKLSSASTGEHAERSASRSRCLKSRNIVFTSVMLYCVF